MFAVLDMPNETLVYLELPTIREFYRIPSQEITPNTPTVVKKVRDRFSPDTKCMSS